MMTPDELAAINQRSDAVLCSNLLHLCDRGVIRSLKDVPRLLADLEAATAEAERHKNNWLGVCDELADTTATLERVRAALSEWGDTMIGFAALRAYLRSLLEQP